jgi:malate dehydrogenase (quinone)
MLEVIKRCFPQHIKQWEPKLIEMIPSYGMSLQNNPELIRDMHANTARTLDLVSDAGESGSKTASNE